MSKLSPIAQLANTSGLNVNPQSQKGLLKYALNKGEGGVQMAEADDADSADENDVDASKFASKKAGAAAREQRRQQLEALQKDGKDVISDAGAIRLPNRISKGMVVDPRTGTAKQDAERDCMASPTAFLRGAASPRLHSFVAGQGDDNST